MNSLRSWRAASILVLLGGALQTLAVFAADPLAPRAPLAPLHAAGIGGHAAAGLGLILAGVGIRRRYPACWLLMVAGGAWLLEAVVLASLRVVVPPRWTLGALLAVVALTMTAAAIGVIVRGGLAGPARWVLALPAAAAVVTAVVWVGGVPSALAPTVPWILVLPAVLPIAVGAVWLFVRDEPRVRSAPAAIPLSRT